MRKKPHQTDQFKSKATKNKHKQTNFSCSQTTNKVKTNVRIKFPNAIVLEN